jgi:hypothetical protein
MTTMWSSVVSARVKPYLTHRACSLGTWAAGKANAGSEDKDKAWLPLRLLTLLLVRASTSFSSPSLARLAKALLVSCEVVASRRNSMTLSIARKTRDK